MDEIVAGPVRGHLALAGRAGPGILLLPDYRGLDATMTAAARRFANRGFPTFVLDLLDGGANASGDAYEHNPSRFLARDLDDVAEDINAAARFLLDHPSVVGDSVCVAGAGGAGAIALWAPAICPAIGAVSAAYPALSLLRLEHVGLDRLTPHPVALHLPAEAAEPGAGGARHVEVFRYPHTRPGFLDEALPETHNAAAAALVWARTMALAVRTALAGQAASMRRSTYGRMPPWR